MQITSTAFQNNQWISEAYTCTGEDINPPLQFSEVPSETVSLVLIVEDPDAPGGTWDHWTVYNIDPSVASVEAGDIPAGGIQLANSFEKEDYGGPCPPPGAHHRYFFKLIALDKTLEPSMIFDKLSLLQLIEGHILAKAELVGLYSR